MGPLAMQHGGSRVVAPPDGEEAPHQTLQEEGPHSCEVNFCFVLFLMDFYGPCFYGSCSSTGFCVRVSSTGDTLLSFALETRFRASFRLPVSGWDKALDEFLLSSRFAPFLCDSGGACVCVFHFPTAGRFPGGFAFYCQLSRSLHLYICACEGTPSLSLWLRVECFILVSRHRRCKQ